MTLSGFLSPKNTPKKLGRLRAVSLQSRLESSSERRLQGLSTGLRLQPCWVSSSWLSWPKLICRPWWLGVKSVGQVARAIWALCEDRLRGEGAHAETAAALSRSWLRRRGHGEGGQGWGGSWGLSGGLSPLLPAPSHPQEVIKSILVSGRIGPDIKLAECYGLRLKHVKSDEIHWLHPELTVGEVQEKYECLHLEAEWR